MSDVNDDPLEDPTYQKWINSQRSKDAYQALKNLKGSAEQAQDPIITEKIVEQNYDVSPHRVCVVGSLKWVWQDAEIVVDYLEKLPRAKEYISIAAGGTDTFCAVYLMDRTIRENSDAVHRVIIPQDAHGVDAWWGYLRCSDDRLVLQEQPAHRLNVYDRATHAIHLLDPHDHDELHLFIGSSAEYTATVGRIAESRGVKTQKTYLFV